MSISDDEKYRRKIRKLLALATSDNPHEAERASAQAKAMMKQHNISEGDVEIADIAGKQLPYLRPRGSDTILILAIKQISGVEAYLRKVREGRSGTVKRHGTPHFIGLQPDAEMAAYCFEVLHRQMTAALRAFEKEHVKLPANLAEDYRSGWALAARTKLVNVFGAREVPENVKGYFEARTGDTPEVKSRCSKDTTLTKDLASLGYRQGQKAQLHAATGEDLSKRARLGVINVGE